MLSRPVKDLRPHRESKKQARFAPYETDTI